MQRARLGALAALAGLLAIAWWLAPGAGDPAAAAALSRPPPAGAGPRVARWFPLKPGRRWRYAVTDPGGEADFLEYRCRRAEGGAFSVFQYDFSGGRARYADVGTLGAGPGDAWFYKKSHQRHGRRWTFLPEDPAPGTRWEVRPGLAARVEGSADPAQLVVRYERPPGPGEEEPAWVRTRWFRRGVGIVREESPARGGKRVLRLLDGGPVDAPPGHVDPGP